MPLPPYDLLSRQARYFTLSSEIAHLDTAQLRSLFDATEAQHGWGRNHVLTIQHAQVFVKRLPLSELEYEHAFSTSNLYDLPLYYQYGVGSAGFGVFRELLAHIKTTNWVLQGATTHFPLLYHYRILPTSGERPAVDRERLQTYIAAWNNNENIGRRALDRLTATYELALFLEYMPYELKPWLLEHPSNITQVLADLRIAIAFLRSKGMIHFDLHFENVISDGEQAYVTDFGLLLDQRFTLTPAEMHFFNHHTYYDYGQVLGSLSMLLAHTYTALPDDAKQRIIQKYGIPPSLPAYGQIARLLDHIEDVVADDLTIDTTYATTLITYQRITQMFLDFYGRMRENPRKDTPFPNEQLGQLLKDTGFLLDPP